MFCLFRNFKSPGSFECRAGYASEIDPRRMCHCCSGVMSHLLVYFSIKKCEYLKYTVQFRNLVGLPKTKRDGEFIMVGDAQLELDHGRMKIRSPFDRNVVTQFELLVRLIYYVFLHAHEDKHLHLKFVVSLYQLQENVFDHVFDMLGVDGDRVDHPLLLTEPVAQPNYSRARMCADLFYLFSVF